MKITFRPASVEDCKMIREWIKINEFTRHWYYFDKIPRLSTLETKMSKKLKLSKVVIQLLNVLSKMVRLFQTTRFLMAMKTK